MDEGTYVVGQRSLEKTLASAVASFGNLDPLQTAGIAQAGYYARIKSDTGIIFLDGYGSVDKVLHPDKMEFYSSKPPLLSTMLAGLYWLLKMLFGWTLAENPNAVVRTILLLVNVLPFILYLQQIARLAEAFGRTDWGRLFVVAAAAFGTVVTPFLITLNNHTIATYCVLFALVSVVEIWKRTPRSRGGCAGSRRNFTLAISPGCRFLRLVCRLQRIAGAGFRGGHFFAAVILVAPTDVAIFPVAGSLVRRGLFLHQLRCRRSTEAGV